MKPPVIDGIGSAEPSSELEPITVRAFRAVDDPVRCATYVHEHVRVLEDIGVFSALKPDLSWCTDPGVIVLVAEHDTLGMVAGIRLHEASPGTVLPMERSVAPLDASIVGILDELQTYGNAEIAGLWNAHRFAGRGVPLLLMEACVAIASRIHVRTLVTFIAEYVAPYAAKAGFAPMAALDSGAVFNYPVADIRTYAMVLGDVLTMTTAESDHRKRILSLRLRPHQLRPERPKKAGLNVQYRLLDPLPHLEVLNDRNAA